MKPYITNRPNNKQLCNCCPGHDGSEAITKWVGCYRSNRSTRAASHAKRIQARQTRRTLKLADRRSTENDV